MKKIINTDKAPAAIGPYSQAIEANGTVYISGQIPIDPSVGKVVEGDIEAQTEQVISNIDAILKNIGLGAENVVKTTCLLSSMSDFPKFNDVYGKYFGQSLPARATFAVKELPLGVLVEVECVAIKDL
ncbi:MAG: RidA family protein [Bacteroidales bacterium]